MNCKTCGNKMTQMIYSSFCSVCDNAKQANSLTEAVAEVKNGWDLESAVKACVSIESIIEPLGFHVALTGGTLYKAGVRKDMDLFIYQNTVTSTSPLTINEVEKIVIVIANFFGTFYHQRGGYSYPDDKVIFKLDNNIDLLFPLIKP